MDTTREKLDWAGKILGVDISKFDIKKINPRTTKAYSLNITERKRGKKVVLTIITVKVDKPEPEILIECLK